MDMTGTDVGLVITDGGRADAGFKGKTDAGDCVTRAIAIAAETPYLTVYRHLSQLAADRGRPRSARDGVPMPIVRDYLSSRLWEWTPTMSIGSGCQVHLRADELPTGRLIARLSGHLCAVIDGVVYDNDDPRRDGTRCVYGYWQPPKEN